jgi:hypothetical protein
MWTGTEYKLSCRYQIESAIWFGEDVKLNIYDKFGIKYTFQQI